MPLDDLCFQIIGIDKYKKFSVIIILTISHGQVAVESGFNLI